MTIENKKIPLGISAVVLRCLVSQRHIESNRIKNQVSVRSMQGNNQNYLPGNHNRLHRGDKDLLLAPAMRQLVRRRQISEKHSNNALFLKTEKPPKELSKMAKGGTLH